MGTIAYMSPEQARGEELDVRTDIFSCGLVLYEMATGERTFQGSTTAVIFDAILNREPTPPVELNANVTGDLQRIIGTAIEKDRTLRYQNASALRTDLQDVREERASRAVASRIASQASSVTPPSGSRWAVASAPVAVTAPAPPPAAKVSRLSLAVAIGGVVCLVGGLLFAYSRYAAPSTTVPVAESEPPAAAPPAEPAPNAPVDPVTTSNATAVSTAPSTPPEASRVPPVAQKSTPTTAPAADSLGDTVRVARAKFDAKLYDQALADLTAAVTRYPSSPNAPSAYLLLARTYDQQRRPDDAMASYVELRSKFSSAPEAAEATVTLADLLLRSKRADRDTTALSLFSEVVAQHPKSPWAPRALPPTAAV
jgi:TolA-binding protein